MGARLVLATIVLLASAPAGALEARTTTWQDAAATNGGQHPLVRPVTARLLRRMRAAASTAIEGAGMATL